MFASHLGGFASNRAGNPFATEGSPAHTTVNLNGGYTFARGLWRGVGHGVKVGVGVTNVFDLAPPFSNTVFGYNGGLYSPLGRSYELSLRVPF